MHNSYFDLTEGSQNMQDINTLIDRGVDVEYEPQRDPEGADAYVDYHTRRLSAQVRSPNVSLPQQSLDSSRTSTSTVSSNEHQRS